jgi:hypothetical protein
MKKIVFISSAVIINLVLLVISVSTFNPSNLPLAELNYFGKFDMTNLFPSTVTGNFLLFGSIISLIALNRYLYKKLAVK